MPRKSKVVDAAGGPLHEFANIIGERRAFLGLTQADVVLRAEGAFRSSALSLWERGTAPPSKEQEVRALADALGLEVDDLVEVWIRGRTWYRSWGPTSIALPGELLQGHERFVGRQQLLDSLGVSWRRARAGDCQTVLVTGNEANGKTWLIGEFARQVHHHGAIVLYGRSREAETSFQPFTDALRPYCRLRPSQELVEDAGAGASAVARLIPEMSSKCADLLRRREFGIDKREEQLQLFEGLESLLGAAARRAPVLLVLDDLHLATRDTLDLLNYLVAPKTSRRLLIVGAFRSRRGARDRPLDAALPHLRMQPGINSITVPGLNRDEVEARVALPTGGAIDVMTADLADVIFSRTNGDSLCVDLMVDGLLRNGMFRNGRWLSDALSAPVPEGLLDAIAERLSRLSAPSKQMLRVAAVIGQTFPLRLLSVIPRATSSPEELDAALAEALLAGVLEPARGRHGHGLFVHDLFREVVCEELEELLVLPQYHLDVAQGYRVLPLSDETVGGMARHYYLARPLGEAEDIVYFNLEAARRAFRGLAFKNAVSCLDQALEVLGQDDACRDKYESEVLLVLSQARLALADPVGSRDAAVSAADAAHRVGAVELLGAAAVRLTEWIDFGESHPRTVGICEEALAALSDDHAALRARVMAGLGHVWAWSEGESGIGDELTRRALSLARTTPDQEVLVTVLCQRTAVLQGSPAVDEQVRLGREALAMAERMGHVRLQALAHAQLSRASLELGDRGDVAKHIEALDRLATGERSWFASTMANMFRTVLALMNGQFNHVDDLAAKTLIHIPDDPTFRSIWAGQMLFLGYELGRLAELRPEVLAAVGSRPGVVAFRAGLVLFLLESGNLEASKRELESLGEGGFRSLPKDPTWTGTLSLLTEAVARLQVVEHAGTLYDLLTPHAGCLALVSSAVCLGAVDRFLGMLAATLEHWEAAEHHFHASLEIEERAAARPHVVRTQLWHARMLLRWPDRSNNENAKNMIISALAEAQSLGMSGVVTELEELLRNEIV